MSHCSMKLRGVFNRNRYHGNISVFHQLSNALKNKLKITLQSVVTISKNQRILKDLSRWIDKLVVRWLKKMIFLQLVVIPQISKERSSLLTKLTHRHSGLESEDFDYLYQMSSSPYIAPDLKQYIKTHKIEETLKEAVNAILVAKPSDPFTSLSQFFGKLAQATITIVSVRGIEIMNSEMKPTIQLVFSISYKETLYEISPQLYFGLPSIEQEKEVLYDDEHKNVKQAIQAISKISSQLQQKVINQGQIDEPLRKYLSENPNHLNVVQQISYSMLYIQSQFLNVPVGKILEQTIKKSETPKLFVNFLQGSKIVASKCKVYKFYLITDAGKQGVQRAQQILAALRKSIVSGKKGEAGLTTYLDGTFICPADTILDNLKMIEAAIEQHKDHVSVGISMLSELFYEANDKKYDLDNPKKLHDTDQLIEYYWKLCQDKPIISYLEDPLHFNDSVGWNKILNKFKDSRVKISSRRLYSNIDKSKKHLEVITPESNPELNEQQIHTQNNERVNLDYIYKTAYEFPTLSDLLQYITYLQTKKPNIQIIIGDNLQDSEDTSIVDIGHAVGNICLGPMSKFEKVIKYNKYLRLFE